MLHEAAMNLSTGPYPTRDSGRQLPEEDDFAELREAAMEDIFRTGARPGWWFRMRAPKRH